jgi:flagellar assembly protein FliH
MISLFHRNFDTETELVAARAKADSLAAGGQPSASAPRSYSPEEVEAMLTQARVVAFADGKATGIAEARTQEQTTREARVADALGSIQAQLAELTQQDDTLRREIEAEMTEMILGIGERVVPDVMESCAIDQVSARIRAGLRMAAGSAGIVIRIAPNIKGPVTERVSEFETIGAGRLEVEVRTDPAMTDSAVRLEWRNGFMEYDLGRACDEVLEALRDSTVKLNTQ